MSSENDSANPFEVLGLTEECNEEMLRQRYLTLVKKYPPDQDPERFRMVQTAYERAKNPLLLAEHLFEQYGRDAEPWKSVIDAQVERRPRLPVTTLLSLGNDFVEVESEKE